MESKQDSKNNDGEEEELDEHSAILCDPCQTDGKQLSAEGYCVNCDEYLCADCHKVHLRPSMTRHHILKDKQNMPSKQPINYELCQMHDEQPIEYYCKSHRALCCSLCVSISHDECKDLKSIADILETIDTQQELDELKRKMKVLENDADETQYLVQKGLKAIAINYNHARLQKSSIRQKFNEYFDKVENNIDLKLNKIRNEDIEKINTHRIKCSGVSFDINTLEDFFYTNIVAKHKYKAFVAMKRAENKIMSNHEDLQRIRQSSTVQRYEFAAESGDEEPVFGHIKLHTSSFKKTVQYVSDLSVNAEEDTQNCHITGITAMSEKYIVVADNSNMSVKLINTTEKKILSQKIMDTCPWDLTCINDKQIAVTLPSSEKIQFLRFQEAAGLESVKELRVGKKCYGIEYIADENKIIMSSFKPGGVEIIDMDGNTLKKFDMYLNMPCYVSLIPREKQIVISDIRINRNNKFIDGSVKYVTFDGRDTAGHVSVETLDNKHIQPLGLTTDHEQGIYVCDHREKIYFISYDRYRKEKEKNLAKNFHFRSNASSLLQLGGGISFSTPGTGTAVANSDVSSSSYFQRHEEHPDILINFTDISPRSVAYCKETFTLYIGEMGNKIHIYSVA